MKTSALFTLILVGAAATASAQPEPAEPSGRVSYTENNAATPRADLPRRGDEVELASATPATHGTEFVVIGKESGAFSKLRLAAASGRVVVRKVRIFFDDGTNQTVQVDTILDAQRGREATIDLKGVKAIDHVSVSTEPGHGSYVLYGTAAR
jgi:hypothetical protein